MRRWSILALFALVLGVGLFQVRRFDLQPVVRDEVLAYEVTHARNVLLPVHAGIEQVTVATWPVLPWGLSAEEVIGYGIEVVLSDSRGRRLGQRRFDARSRVLVDPNSADPPARLADGSALIGGSRSLDVDVSKLRENGGTMTITAARGAHERVLLLATHKVRRTAFEQAVLERSVGLKERARVVGQRSSLGFFDLPEETRVESLAHRTRRLTALGREGVSYQTRRLLLGERPEAPPPNDWQSLSTPVGPGHHLALNVTGPVALNISGAIGLVLGIREGAGQDLIQHVLPKQGSIELLFDGEGTRTLFVESETESEVALSVSEAEAAALVGDVVRLPTAGRLPLSPDIRRFTYYRLSPTEPLKYSIVQGQSLVGFSARIALADVAHDLERPQSAWFEVDWLDTESKLLARGKVDFSVVQSRYETLAGKPVTDAQRGRLRVPRGAASLLLRGAPGGILSVDTNEPGVNRSILAPAYGMELGDHVAFRNAPFIEKTWAVLRPDNAAVLEKHGRSPRVHAQVRIEQSSSQGHALTERPLKTLGITQSRYVFTPTTYSPRYQFPANAWTELAESAKSIVVPSDGRLSLSYLANPDRLGESWSLFVSGDERLRIRLTTPAGSRSVRLTPGLHDLRVDGLGPGGSVMARAPPGIAGRVFKRHQYYSLAQGGRLRFRLERGENELLSVVLIVTSVGSNQDVALNYRLRRQSGGLGQTEPWLYHRQTLTDGELTLRTGVRGRALLWSAEGHLGAERLPDRVGAVTLALGDDLRPGARTLELRRAGGEARTAWVRAVAVGRRMDPDGLRWSRLDTNEAR